MTGLTHRALCRGAARWLFTQRWVHVAGWEVGDPHAGVQLDAVGVSIPDAVAVANYERTVSPSRRERYPLALARGRLAVVECKRTRADLRADLRAGKMQGYANLPGVTECWLAITEEVFPSPPGTFGRTAAAATIAAVTEVGLPATWGVLLVGQGAWCNPIRRAVRAGDTPDAQRVVWAARVARSLAWRGLDRDSPEADREDG